MPAVRVAAVLEKIGDHELFRMKAGEHRPPCNQLHALPQRLMMVQAVKHRRLRLDQAAAQDRKATRRAITGHLENAADCELLQPCQLQFEE